MALDDFDLAQRSLITWPHAVGLVSPGFSLLLWNAFLDRQGRTPRFLNGDRLQYSSQVTLSQAPNITMIFFYVFDCCSLSRVCVCVWRHHCRSIRTRPTQNLRCPSISFLIRRHFAQSFTLLVCCFFVSMSFGEPTNKRRRRQTLQFESLHAQCLTSTHWNSQPGIPSIEWRPRSRCAIGIQGNISSASGSSTKTTLNSRMKEGLYRTAVSSRARLCACPCAQLRGTIPKRQLVRFFD